MLELRWLTRPCKSTWSDGVERTVYIETVLQYRVYRDTNAYAGMGPFPESQRRMAWSDWMDVPKVQEDFPS